MSQRGLGGRRRAAKRRSGARHAPSRRPDIADAGDLAQRGNTAGVGCPPVSLSLSPSLPTCCGEEACPALARERENWEHRSDYRKRRAGEKDGGEESLFYLSIILQVLTGVPLCTVA